MATIVPTPPKGMRDFGPKEMRGRQYLFDTIRSVFHRFGFQPLETPAMERLDVLTGKYGEEGDRLIFKVLNSGDYFKSLKDKIQSPQELDSKKHLSLLSEKALKYDLTVPFARYVAQNRHALSFPFRRYQIQPVWRADNPQKGRYREFYQCDADIIGSTSLLNEVELLLLFSEVFTQLGFPNARVYINNRKILTGIAETLHVADRFTDLMISIDKFDKIGWEGVAGDLAKRGFTNTEIIKISEIFAKEQPDLKALETLLATNEIGTSGLKELNQILELTKASESFKIQIVVDIKLARGLDYYTGSIFEVKIQDSGMGSVAAGGRYDDLTGIFGLKDTSGVGISFGADRLYDLMLQGNLFPQDLMAGPEYFFLQFEPETIVPVLQAVMRLRDAGKVVGFYPDGGVKIGKQMKYADSIGARYVCMLGTEELKNGNIRIKQMESGEEQILSLETFLKNGGIH